MSRDEPTPLLALETSQREGGVAVRDRQGEVHIERLSESARYDETLMPTIDAMLKRAGLSPRDLRGVGVSAGPGGFTGLRIAITTAKVLAMVLDTRVVAVPSALVAVESSDIPRLEQKTRRILVALAAKRNSYWKTVVYEDTALGWRIQGEPHLTDAPDRTDEVDIVLADRYFPDEARSSYEEAGIPIIIPRFDPAACLRLTDRHLSASKTDDPFAIEPIYPRAPEAVSIWDQRHGDTSRITSRGVQ